MKVLASLHPSCDLLLIFFQKPGSASTAFPGASLGQVSRAAAFAGKLVCHSVPLSLRRLPAVRGNHRSGNLDTVASSEDRDMREKQEETQPFCSCARDSALWGTFPFLPEPARLGDPLCPQLSKKS